MTRPIQKKLRRASLSGMKYMPAESVRTGYHLCRIVGSAFVTTILTSETTKFGTHG